MLSNYTGKYTGSEQTIVIIDAGISNNYTNNVIYSYDFADNDEDAVNTNMDHGGQMAYIAQKIAPNIKIIHLKVIADGFVDSRNDYIERALKWVADSASMFNITAVNLSLSLGNVQKPTIWEGSDEYQLLNDKGVIVTVASGNGGELYKDGVSILASSENIISVSAVNSNHKFADFSQQHKDLTDIAALGENINVIDDNSLVHTISGTSCSSPIIAAAAAIVQEASIELLGHKITNEEFIKLIQKTGDKITDYSVKIRTTRENTETPLHAELSRTNDDSIENAYKTGVLNAFNVDFKVFIDTVDSITDNKDFYQFILSESGTVDFSLSKLSADIDLNLYDSNGKSIHDGWTPGNDDVAYTRTLTAGTYYAEVSYFAGAAIITNYQLKLIWGDVIPTEGTDGLIETANNLGILSAGTISQQDSIHKITDDKDYYKFEIQPTEYSCTVDFLLSELSTDVDLNLYKGDGELMHEGWVWGGNDISYTKNLIPGVYYLEVDYYDDDNNQTTFSDYTLSITMTEFDPNIIPTDPIFTNPVGYTEINIANAITYLETHQSEYNDQIVL